MQIKKKISKGKIGTGYKQKSIPTYCRWEHKVGTHQTSEKYVYTSDPAILLPGIYPYLLIKGMNKDLTTMMSSTAVHNS